MVAAEVGGFDLELVVAVLEECGAPAVGEVEAVEAGFALAVLAGAGRVDPSEGGAWAAVVLLSSIGVCQGRTVWSPRRMRQRIRAGVTGRLSQGGGTLRAGIWWASAITSTGPKIEVGRGRGRCGRTRSWSPVAWWCLPRGQRSGSEGVAVEPGAAFGEMEVQPGCGDVPDELVAFDVLVVADGRDDVPVAEETSPSSTERLGGRGGGRRRRGRRRRGCRWGRRCRSRSGTRASCPRCGGR